MQWGTICGWDDWSFNEPAAKVACRQMGLPSSDAQIRMNFGALKPAPPTFAPYAPHPTPHTLHPTPYTLHPTPHTPNPEP